MAFREKIHFRCWYCNRKLSARSDRVGARRVCNCGSRYRVPSEEGIAPRDKTPLDWLLEFVIYGFGGGFFGFLIGSLILRCTYWGIRPVPARLLLVAVPTAIGFLAGGLFGERGINWIGSLVSRIYEDDYRH